MPSGSIAPRFTLDFSLFTFHFSLPLFPDFIRIDDVLPKDIAAGTDGGDGVEIHVSHPYCHARVFLEHALSAVDALVEVTTDATANDEMQYADTSGKQGNHQEDAY